MGAKGLDMPSPSEMPLWTAATWRIGTFACFILFMIAPVSGGCSPSASPSHDPPIDKMVLPRSIIMFNDFI